MARKQTLKMDSAVCAYCGKTYTPTGSEVTCSPECAKEYKRIARGMVAFKAGRAKNPPSYVRYSSGLPQSGMVGVNYHRKTGKWQVSHKGKYIGLFGTQEEAEKKKKELEAKDHEADQ